MRISGTLLIAATIGVTFGEWMQNFHAGLFMGIVFLVLIFYQDEKMEKP